MINLLPSQTRYLRGLTEEMTQPIREDLGGGEKGERLDASHTSHDKIIFSKTRHFIFSQCGRGLYGRG